MRLERNQQRVSTLSRGFYAMVLSAIVFYVVSAPSLALGAETAVEQDIYWTDVGQKQALVCQLSTLTPCLASLPQHIRRQLPETHAQFHDVIGQRGAVVLSVEDNHIAGLILVSAQHTPKESSAYLRDSYVYYPLKLQAQLTLWHELGHLEAIALQRRSVVSELDAYQHEWLADSYLIWRIARQRNSLELAWQQYHRRNMDVMGDKGAISHWSVPILAQLFARYSLQELREFEQFSALMADFLPELVQPSEVELSEYASLFQHLFSPSALQFLPNYIYWRKPVLGSYLYPTVEKVLGRDSAMLWFKQLGFQPLESTTAILTPGE